MSRRRRATKREQIPDSRYNSTLVSFFINGILKQGKKTIAEKIFYGSLEFLEKKNTKEPPLDTFKKAMQNVRPTLEVKSRRIGGANYQIPIEVPVGRRDALAMRWILESARTRKGGSMMEKLGQEFLSAYSNEGAAVKKKDDTHRMAEANKAFAHFRFR